MVHYLPGKVLKKSVLCYMNSTEIIFSLLAGDVINGLIPHGVNLTGILSGVGKLEVRDQI